MHALPSVLKEQLLYVITQMIIRKVKTVLYVILTQKSLIFILLQYSYLLFTSTTSKYAKREISYILLYLLKHLCPMLWRLVLYLKADEQGARHLLSAAVIYKALC